MSLTKFRGFLIGLALLWPLNVLAASGDIDTSFNFPLGYQNIQAGQLGELERGWGIGASAFTILPGGEVLVAGSGHVGMFLIRFDTNGHLDTTFGNGNGFILLRETSWQNLDTHLSPMTLSMQQDGKIIVCGSAVTDVWHGPFIPFLARFNGDGSLDTTFGGGLVYQDPESESALMDAKETTNGKILVVTNNGHLLLYQDDGTLDTTFNPPDIQIPYPVGGARNSFFVRDMNLLSDGGLILSGVHQIAPGDDVSYGRAFVARLTSDGILDASFGQGGFAYVPGYHDTWDPQVHLQPNGKILLAGNILDNWFDVLPNYLIPATFVTRFNSDGTTDDTFGNEGLVQLVPDGRPTAMGGLSLQPDGKIMVSGVHWVYNEDFLYPWGSGFVTRLTPNGSPDPSFSLDGWSEYGTLYIGFYYSGGRGMDIKVLPDGRMITVGNVYAGPYWQGPTSLMVMRLLGDDVMLLSPNGGEHLRPERRKTISWKTSPSLNQTDLIAKLSLSVNGGHTWRTIARSTPDTGSFRWRVPAISSRRCRIRLLLKNSLGRVIASDRSNGFFSILNH